MTTKEAKQDAEKALGLELLEAVLKPVKSLKEPWKKTPEIEQRAFLNQLQYAVNEAVKRAVNTIAADKRPTMECLVDQVVFKDGIKCVMTLAKSSADRHELADAQGQSVLIVITNAEKFKDKSEVKPDKDQPGLPGVPNPDEPSKVKKDGRTKRGGKK